MAIKIRSFLISFVTVCTILGTSSAIIAYGKGYRINFNKSTLSSTGLISATSDPIGAQVFIENKLKTATNNSFNITPGFYQVTIAKEGYTSWQKKLRVQGEIVSRADAYLFPVNPSLSPLTTLGVKHPTLSPDGSKIAYIIPLDHLENGVAKKAGIWVFALTEGPLGRNRDPIQIATLSADFDAEKAALQWSPDSSQILVTTNASVRLYQPDKLNIYQDISKKTSFLLTDWQREQKQKELQQLEAFKQPIIDIATSSARILSFSPDETKILYEATQSATLPKIIDPPLIGTNPTEEMRKITAKNIYVYDSKEDKNYLILSQTELQKSKTVSLQWFPTSKHLLYVMPGKIDIMEYDRTNWVTVYAGPFDESFLAPWSNGSRIVILTNLNPGVSTLPNLYTVNLR